MHTIFSQIAMWLELFVHTDWTIRFFLDVPSWSQVVVIDNWRFAHGRRTPPLDVSLSHEQIMNLHQSLCCLHIISYYCDWNWLVNNLVFFWIFGFLWYISLEVQRCWGRGVSQAAVRGSAESCSIDQRCSDQRADRPIRMSSKHMFYFDLQLFCILLRRHMSFGFVMFCITDFKKQLLPGFTSQSPSSKSRTRKILSWIHVHRGSLSPRWATQIVHLRVVKPWIFGLVFGQGKARLMQIHPILIHKRFAGLFSSRQTRHKGCVNAVCPVFSFESIECGRFCSPVPIITLHSFVFDVNFRGKTSARMLWW